MRLSGWRSHWRSVAIAEERQLVHIQGLNKSRAFWPAGSKAIAKVDPSVTVSISLIDSKVAALCGFAKRKVYLRMKDEANRADEAKDRTYKEEERIGRKEESLEREDELTEEQGKQSALEREEDACDREIEGADRPDL